MAGSVPQSRREQIQDGLGTPLSYASGVEATKDDELPTKKYVDDHGGRIDFITLALGAYVDQDAWKVIGAIAFVANQVPSGTVYFFVVGAVTDELYGGQVRLYNLTDSSVTDSMDIVSLTPSRIEGVSSPIALAAGKIYEVRARVGTGGGLLVTGAFLEVR